MSESIPSTMKAFVWLGDHKGGVETIPVPSIDDDEVLVKVAAVAQNPTDWLSLKLFEKTGVISGCDYSGHVVKTGKNVTLLSVGDHVAGFVQGSNHKDRGAFAEYLKVPEDLTLKIPEGTLSHEEASTLGCALWTAIQGLFHPKKLGLVEPPTKVNGEQWVYIYGASSSVGMFAVQLVHAAGYKIVATCSPRNFELVKSFGADAVFDYNDPDYISKVKEATGDSIHLAFGAISVPKSQQDTMKVLAPGPGRYWTVLPVDAEAKALRPDVTIDFTLVTTALGMPFELFGTEYPVVAEDRAHAASFVKRLSVLLKSGQLKPNPIRVVPGGLEGVAAGMKVMEEGKVSGIKIVHRLS